MSEVSNEYSDLAENAGNQDTQDQSMHIPAGSSDVSHPAKNSSIVAQVAASKSPAKARERDELAEGLFVAALSRNDRSTPFWVAKIISLPSQNSRASETRKNVVIVRWYQASGSARDPFDAAYIPARRSPMMGEKGVDRLFWESAIGVSEIITTFEKLSNENRIDSGTVTNIKEKLYS